LLPSAGDGVIWDSRRVDSQPMLVGSFIPYLWIGSDDAGLCWFADSDQGWEPSPAAPAIAIERDASGTRLVLNLISAPTTLAVPRTLSFAVQATPVKPIHRGWRMDSWWTGDTFRDYAQVETKGGHLIFTSLPFPLDVAKSKAMADERHANTNAHIFGFAKYRENVVPYFEHIALGDGFVPEAAYFAEEWRTTTSRGFDYGGPFADFMVHHVAAWARDGGIDGFYLDNVHPIADDNISAGRGWLLPDGRVQPTYRMFATRRYMLRLRAALHENGKRDKFVIHMTNNMIIPWIGAADIALDGELNVIYPEHGKDFIDCWSTMRLRGCVPSQWGVAVNFLQEHQGDWQREALIKAMRAYTGLVLAHDILASANANGLNPEAWIAREAFGMAEDDVRFVGYWQPGAVAATPTTVLASAWLRPGAALIVAVNTGGAAEVELDLRALGLDARFARDAETKAALPVLDGRVRATIARHDYRHILVTAQEAAP
nr:hypothetical protein [Planctomycetota bacterium]